MCKLWSVYFTVTCFLYALASELKKILWTIFSWLLHVFYISPHPFITLLWIKEERYKSMGVQRVRTWQCRFESFWSTCRCVTESIYFEWQICNFYHLNQNIFSLSHFQFATIKHFIRYKSNTLGTCFFLLQTPTQCTWKVMALPVLSFHSHSTLGVLPPTVRLLTAHRLHRHEHVVCSSEPC